MKISIITPSYNSAKTVKRTIDSIVSQTYRDIEYIVVDGGSSDETSDIVLNYQDKIMLKFISEPDNGIYDAMNKGIKMATGEIIGILNSDDFYSNNNLLQIISEAFNDLKIDAVYGDVSYFGDNENEVTRYWKAGIYKESKLNNGWIIPHPALFLRKSVYDKCGVFNIKLKIAADYEFILRLLKIYKINVKYVPQVFVRMYNGGVSGSSIKQRQNGWQEMKNAWRMNDFKVPIFFTFRRLFFKFSQYLVKINS